MGALVVRGGALATVASVGTAFAISSCGAVAYHAQVPHTAQDPDLVISVDEVGLAHMVGAEPDGERTLTLGATVSARPGAAWGRPRINSAARSPCDGGLLAKSDGTSTPPREGVQHASLVFADVPGANEPFADGSSVLDLPVFPADRAQPGRCLRVPLQLSGGATEWRSTPWLSGLAFRVVFLTRPLAGYQDLAILFELPQAVWIDGWWLMAGFEGGFVGERGVAPPTPPSTTRATVGLVGGELEAARMLWVGRRLGLQLRLGYDLLATLAPNAQSSAAEAAAYQPGVVHGPRVALRLVGLLSLRPGWPGFAAPAEGTSAGLSAFAGAWWQSSGAATPAPILGLSIDGTLSF